MSNVLAVTLNTESLLSATIPTGTLSATQSIETLFSDRYVDRLYLDNNQTFFTSTGTYYLPILSAVEITTETESAFSAVFGNIASLYYTQNTSTVFSGSIQIDGSFVSSVNTDIILDNIVNEASFVLTSGSEVSFSAYLVITGTFGVFQDSILSFLGYPENTSSDIGQVTSSKPILVMNIDSQGVSEYTHYDFNSFFELNGKYYGCAYSGIFLLEGTSDNSVQIAQAVAKTAISDFNTQKMKSVRDGYAYIRSSGDMLISVTTNEQIERNNYPLYYDGVDGIHRRRVKTAQGLRGTTWQVSVKNDSGADFTIKQVDIIPVELDRSI